MKEVEIKIEPLSLFYGGSSTYRYEDNTIILREWVDENNIEVVFNHEYLHAVIHRIINECTSRRLDRLFYDNIGKCVKGYDIKTKQLDGIDEYGVPY